MYTTITSRFPQWPTPWKFHLPHLSIQACVRRLRSRSLPKKEIIYRTKAGYFVKASYLSAQDSVLKEYYRSMDEEKGLTEFLFSREIPARLSTCTPDCFTQPFAGEAGE